MDQEQYCSSVSLFSPGKPRREFMYSLDCADAIVHLAEHLSSEELSRSPQAEAGFYHVNIGTGEDISIADLATLIAQTVGYTGAITFDDSKPDGTPRKLLDVSYLKKTGWSKARSLASGLAETVAWYLKQ